MIYANKGFRVIELLEVGEKVLAVWFEVEIRNGTRKWLVERDWRNIERALEQFIGQKKHLKRKEEEIQASGEILLKINCEPCSENLPRFFGMPGTKFYGNHLKINISYLEVDTDLLNAEEMNEEKIVLEPDILISSQSSDAAVTFSDEDGYIPESTGPSVIAATYTPSKKSKTTGHEEYVPDGIPEIANQYKAKRRKRDPETTPDLLETSPPAAGTSVIPESTTPLRKSARKKRDICLLNETQMPPSTTKVPPKSSESKVKPRKGEELFGSDSDQEVSMIMRNRDENKNRGVKDKKKVTLTGWLTKEGGKDAKDSPSRKRDLRILSPTRDKKKRKPRKEKEHKASPRTPLNCKIPKLPEVSPGRKNCFHMSIQALLKTFSLIEEEMDPIVERFKESQGRYAPKIRDFNFIRYVDIIQTEQIKACTNFLGERYRSRDNPNEDYQSLINWLVTYVLAEWTLRVFMLEHKMTRTGVIKYFEERDTKDGLEWNLDSLV
ncbi:hypothetical protein DMENIID0001_068330 [Sergentomyia squamirostris]